MKSESDIYEVINCADDDEYRVYSETCDKICVERFLKSQLKSGIHMNNNHKRKQLNVFK